ncbi:DUF4233 domain-containing protein [Serinibacter salmoneus]|uniref:Uncharacterized protein DUF4233 n=1 Tax=Serinibacter salmoneus TaxID=556530 RepID=A0A2A9CYU5_9MICO|nr:DUF4233 domain-containing protein [Serinibacter salmoneus]PFG19296.1 uncharacterized protein DUF4233 [Serinibacter salmoneus]
MSSAPAPQVPQSAPAAPRSARRLFSATVLSLEAFVVFFAALAAYGLAAVPTRHLIVVGSVAALACLVAAGALRWTAGYVLGWVIQAGLLVAGLMIPEMRVQFLIVAVVFALLWVIGLHLGARIDAERQERYLDELDHAGLPRPSR